MVGGGIERVTLTLIKEFQRRGVECCLALRRAHGEFIDEAYELVDVVELAGSGMHRFVPSLSGLIRDFGPTHIVTAMPDITLLSVVARWRAASIARIIQGVHLTQARAAYAEGLRGGLSGMFERAIGRCAYGRVDALVAVSKGVREELIKEFGVCSSRVLLIYNPIIYEERIGGRAAGCGVVADRMRFVAVGRLSRQKGFDVLIQALSLVDGDWQLDIYGGGPEYDALDALIGDYGLGSRVFLHGHTDDPYGEFDKADWIIMPSRFEGFGVVLVEAMARGVPAIASDCPHGPGEILDDGRFGVLVPANRGDKLATALRDVLAGKYEFDSDVLRNRAMEYSVSVSAEKWIRMLAETDLREQQ